MSCDAFLSEVLFEVDNTLEKLRERVCVYKIADGADGKSQMYVLFCYFA